ncbi:acyltransferase family protein [Salinicola peritrichatus]|uniref:acyltransferase family protein n=1 Tax=Salinicola peritrichatus TaxID=1267424 RepID=UPI000DA20125|nr:acyltransferase [Salinicola peritrichatus]
MVFNIQALRALAALMVVFHHVILHADSYGVSLIYMNFLSGWGASGVDIFFVISGFVMVYTQMRVKRTPMGFLKNRIERIVPIYWLLTLVMVSLLLLMPALFREKTFDLVWFVTSMTMTSQFFTGSHPIINVGWTLEYEMLFYVLFACSLVLRGLFGTVLMTSALLGFVYLLGYSDAIIFEFMLGMGVAYAFRARIGAALGYPLLLAGGLLLGMSLIVELGWHRLFVWGVPAALIVMGACYVPQINNAMVLFLGEASYSIYLTHMFALPLIYKLAIRFLPSIQTDLLGLLCFVVAVAGGCVFYRCIEQPITRRFKARRLVPEKAIYKEMA